MIKSVKNLNNKHVISCGCIVYRFGPTWEESEILLIKQFADSDVWSIPKGKMKPGESIEECAIRETREETGISVKLGERLSDTKLALKNKDKTVIAFLAQQVCNKAPAADDPDCEVSAAAWFFVKKLPELQEYQKKVIHEALSRLKISLEEVQNE